MKRRQLIVAFSLILFVTFTGIVQPTPTKAAPVCSGGTLLNFSGDTTFTILVTSPYPFPAFFGITSQTFITNPSPPPPSPANFTATFTVIASGPWSVCLPAGLSLITGGSGSSIPACQFPDGRLNCNGAGQTVA